MMEINEPWHDPACVCTFYGGEYDRRRSHNKDCPVHSTFPKTGLYTLPVATKIWRKRRSEDVVWEGFITTRPCHYTHDELLRSWKLDQDAFIIQINDPSWPIIKILHESITPPLNFTCVDCGQDTGIRLAYADGSGSKWCADCWHEQQVPS